MNVSGLFARFAVLAALAAIVGGCAGPQKMVHEQRRFFWPPLPERPRIEWVKSYYSQLDFPKTGMRQFMAGIAGDEEPISFMKPLDIKSNGKGKIYVSDAGVQGVFVYDLAKSDVHMLGKENSSGLFKQVIGVAVDSADNVYVSDAEKNLVLAFTADEKPLRTIELGPHVLKGGGLTIDNQRSRLYVADTKGHRIVAFGLDGKHLFSFGQRGDADASFNYPIDVDVNSKGDIIVADSMNARVQIFDSEGKFLRKFGRRGDGLGDFQIIKAVAVDSDDNIYVTDGKGHKVEIFSAGGDYLLSVGGLYSVHATGKEAPGGFLIPQGIDIDNNDAIYVVDQLNRRFQVFQYLSDRFLKANPIPGVELK
ncbi:MAG: 6-bladed beta-propeller [Desulfuromonadales bacterium]|nr:MAG: 6-bladed beta-propeller [Desulfuromonadales bacterium]